MKPFTKLHLNHLQKNIKKAPLHKNDGEEDASIEGWYRAKKCIELITIHFFC